jgi:hypothetical protein
MFEIQSYHANLPAQTDEAEVSALLSGDAGKRFVPTLIAIKVVSATGVIAQDGSINVGTTPQGNEIAAAEALTGLTTAGQVRKIPLTTKAVFSIAGNARLYVNVFVNDSTATTLVLDVYVVGPQF